MKKILQILLFLAFSIKSFAQMDTEHWFAPIFDTFNYSLEGYDNSLNGDFLYLSTDSANDFEIIIYSGEVELKRVSIRKGNPKYVKLDPKIITTLDDSDTFKVAKKGLHLVGSHKFFANLRILRGPHAEIINSKGFAGLGTDFYAMTSPLSKQQINLNSQVNIIATENNTSVKISGYDPDILFQNGSQSSELNIKLNRGDSYIVSVPNRPPYVVDSTGLGDPDANYFGLLGANIRSNKPISVINGNFNGTYVNDSGGNDILMDQATPVNRLGREFVVAKGNGPIRASDQGGIDSERVIVMATKDNTKFTLNDSPTVYSLNKGKRAIIFGSESYIKQGTDIYNMYIKSTEDIYVYQFLAGNEVYDSASGGMNMIPSLNCLLPNQIVELPEVNQIGTKDDFETTVNIITKKGAQVKINGESLNGLYGPYPVSGTSEWVLFTKKDVKGNLSIYSTAAVTAGLAGGSKAVGYGGYFGGFSSIPQITKTGDCTAAQKLQVDDGYDSYEWYYNNVMIASGTKMFFINPENYGSGNYYCKIFKKDCGDFTTDVFVYIKCPLFSTKNLTTSNCKTLGIPVVFSSDPLKPINWDNVTVTKQPQEGRADFDMATKKIIFDPKSTDLKTVTFKYYFEGTGTLPDSEEVTVTVDIAQINLKNPKILISSCLQNQIGSYNLKDEYETKNNDPSISRYEYYKDSAFGQIIPDSQLYSYPSKPGDTVFIKIYNSYDCFKTGEIYLNTFELPVIKTIDVKGNTSVTINVTQGKPPYLYYIKKDGLLDYLPSDSDYSTSNILPIKEGKGNYIAYVKSADNCDPVTQEFVVVGVPNIITPNDDGKNDIIDMSILNSKTNPKFQIFTRNTRIVFEGDTANNFIWNGKQNGSPLPTGTYWYLLQWQDFEDAEPNVLNGWILLKNRSSD